MYKNKTFLAIIPARGGSKRLPHKNVLDLAGKPLIAWSIEAAIASSYLDAIIVSSDNLNILKIAQQYEVQTIQRPDKLASDTASSFDAVKHAIENLSHYDYVVLLQPTSPMREAFHIDEAIELLDRKNADAVISVCEMDHSPLWSNTLPENGDMSGFLHDELKNKRSQDFEKHYKLNGAIYICKTDKLLVEKSFFLEKNIFAYIMSSEYSVDIDTIFDLKFAKYLKEQN